MSFRHLASLGLILGLLFALFAFSTSTTLSAGNIIVNDPGDNIHSPGCTTTGTGTCSLRDAINFANTNGGEDTITFSITGPITLGAPLPNINDSLTINGAVSGSSVTVDGASSYNAFTVNPSVTLNLTLLTITNAWCQSLSCNGGGGIRNNGGNVSITQSTFSNNAASVGSGGAIANVNNGTLTISNSIFSGNAAPGGSGGAIINDSGALTVSGSTFTNNSTYIYNYGGGIWVNDGTATVTDSTFSNNATGYGGGMYVTAGTANVHSSTFYNNEGRFGGGGIYNANGTLTLGNSTFSQNYVNLGNGGALYNLNGALYVYNSTIYNNSASQTTFDTGGIYNDGQIAKIRNTILANNSEWQCKDASGQLTANKYNLATDGTCGNATQVTADQLALGPLQNNDGPTETIALGGGSVALNAGDNDVCAASPVNNLDQRGVPRPQFGICDVGAFESTQQFGPNFIVNDSADTDDGLCGNLAAGFSNCTLREALNAANTRKGADNITFNIPSGTNGCTAANQCRITLASILPAIRRNLTIDGSANEGRITIDGTGVQQVFVVNSTKTFNLNALNIVNGSCACSDGGGIINLVGATLNVTKSTFEVNPSSSGDGAGVLNYGTANVSNSTFGGNSATGEFGGILNEQGGTLSVTNSTLAGMDYGIYVSGGTATLRNTIVAGNSLHDCINSGALSANKYNLDTDGSCNKATTKTAWQIALGPLQNNRGPTLTMKPAATSAAVNAGNNVACAAAPVNDLDQRGVKRPQGTNCDVGAVEVRVK